MAAIPPLFQGPGWRVDALTAAQVPQLQALFDANRGYFQAINGRDAAPDDARCLGVPARQVFHDTDATDGIRPEIAREALGGCAPAVSQRLRQAPEVAIQVAERQGHLVGFAQLTLGARHPLVDSPMPAAPDRLHGQAPFTGRGLGRALLHAAEREAARRGAGLLWLPPWVHNTRARRFDARQGHADIGATGFEFEGERHENRRLTRQTTPATAR